MAEGDESERRAQKGECVVHLSQWIRTELCKPGKFEDGETEIPFEFKLEPLTGQTLYETYHGVFVNIQYLLKADMPRPLLAKNLQKSLEFIVEVQVRATKKS